MTGGYDPYPSSRESGIVWLGQVPEHWEVAKLGFRVKTIVPMRDKPTNLEGEIPWVRIEDFSGKFIEGSKSGQGVNATTIAAMHLKIFPVGAVLCSCSCNMGRAAIVSSPVISNQTFIGLVPEHQTLASDYLYYLMQAATPELTARGTGAIQQYLSQDDFKALRFAFPPRVEQSQIAKFLDYETAKIDALIEKQQELIAFLKEKRQAVISHAVTKGLNPDAPMRDSGVEWLGEVPAHWEVRAISKCITKITNGYVGPTRDILVAEGVSYVQATHIKNGVVNFDGAYFVRKEWSAAHSKSVLGEGDVLIVQTGAGTGDVGLVSQHENGFNCHALIILTSDTHVMTGAYLSLALQSEYGRAVLFSIRTGGMHPHLNCGEVKFVKVPVPPVDEQRTITGWVEEQLVRFGGLETKALQAVELLQERRTALISAAVTGKIDVRGWKASNAETEAEVA